MNTPNLFLRIEDYAKENFTTEILAYILETDPKIKNAFLDLLLKDRPKLRTAFRSCEIETQPRYHFWQPDLEIRSTSDRHTKLFVEVKTQSPEGESQIQKYLEGGYVAYLTPPRYDAPDLDGADAKKFPPKYLGQFLWPRVHSLIQKAGSQNILHEQFLKYLEARRMGPSEPISKDDLSASLHAADAIRKLQELVDAVREKIQSDWVREFGKNVGGKGVARGLETGSLPYWWFRADDWVRPNRRLYLSIGVWAEEGGPHFYVALGTRKTFGRELEGDREFVKLRNNIRWKTDDTIPSEWECYKSFPVGTGNIYKIAQQQIKNIRSVKKEISKLIKFVKKKPVAL